MVCTELAELVNIFKSRLDECKVWEFEGWR